MAKPREKTKGAREDGTLWHKRHNIFDSYDEQFYYDQRKGAAISYK